MDYLAQQELNQEDIASLLGYAEPSAFYRAFKRWTGKTPKEYQAE
jgi:AraC-like DNA-binding protein